MSHCQKVLWDTSQSIHTGRKGHPSLPKKQRENCAWTFNKCISWYPCSKISLVTEACFRSTCSSAQAVINELKEFKKVFSERLKIREMCLLLVLELCSLGTLHWGQNNKYNFDLKKLWRCSNKVLQYGARVLKPAFSELDVKKGYPQLGRTWWKLKMKGRFICSTLLRLILIKASNVLSIEV